MFISWLVKTRKDKSENSQNWKCVFIYRTAVLFLGQFSPLSVNYTYDLITDAEVMKWIEINSMYFWIQQQMLNSI